MKQNDPLHMQGLEKLCQKMASFLEFHLVWGYLGLLKYVISFNTQAENKLRLRLEQRKANNGNDENSGRNAYDGAFYLLNNGKIHQLV